MNVFVIGNANSIWVKEYIENTHHKLGNSVFLTDFYGVSDADALYYDNLGVKLVPVCLGNDISKSMRMLAFAKDNKGKIDLVDIQSPPHSLQSYLIKNIIKILHCRSIVCFWGSDILRINKIDSKKLENMLVLSDRINIATKHMCEVFRSFFGSRYDSKLTYAKYGSPAITEIDRCIESNSYYKSYFGLDTGKTTVAIGNNGKKEQNHLRVIEMIREIDEEHKGAVELVVHLAYGGDRNYFLEIEKELQLTGIKCTIIKEMLPVEEVAKLRKATDIFINAQQTDGLSGSMRESFYAGAIVINPVWLDYSELDTIGVQYYKYNSFEQLPDLLNRLLTGQLDSIDTQLNSQIIYDNYSWEAVFPDWMEIING